VGFNSYYMKYEKFGTDVAYQAGKMIRNGFNHTPPARWKKDHSPVTSIDLAINKLVITAIKNSFPEHSILSEEANGIIKKSAYTWVCDPLDGTISFTHQIPTCCFSLALVYKGQSIFGVVYDPFMDRLFLAEKNLGAFLNNKKIHVSRDINLEDSVIGIPLWNRAQYDSATVAAALQRSNVFPINLFSIGYMGALVASGSLSAALYFDNKPHDVAALKIIVEEAGGIVTDLQGKDQSYDRSVKGAIISNKRMHPKLVSLVKKHTTLLS
jgi:myo-inositol-1(or 4)-monophosphatase